MKPPGQPGRPQPMSSFGFWDHPAQLAESDLMQLHRPCHSRFP